MSDDEREVARADVRQFGAAFADARAAREQARADLFVAIRAAARAGVPETVIADDAGVNRLTVRDALGKRPGRRRRPEML